MFVSILTCNDRQDRAQLRNEFLAFDTENTGTITQIQVGSCLKCLSFEYWFGFIYPYVFWKDQVYTVFPFVWDSWKIETVWTHCLSFVHVFQCCQRFALWMFFVLDASQKCLILQKTNWWYCKFAYVQSVPDHESKFTSIGTFLYRLLSTLLTLQAYQKRLPPTHPMGCSPFIHVGSRWPDERNSGEVLSHRHPWGWGIAPEVAAVTKTVMVRMVFFFGMRYAMTSSWLWSHVSLKKLTYKVCAVGGAVCLSKWPFKKKTRQAMFNSMDTDHDDVIAYSEFLAAAMQAISRAEVRK